MKSARHNLILEIIDTMDIETQEELAEELKRRGVRVIVRKDHALRAVSKRELHDLPHRDLHLCGNAARNLLTGDDAFSAVEAEHTHAFTVESPEARHEECRCVVTRLHHASFVRVPQQHTPMHGSGRFEQHGCVLADSGYRTQRLHR